MKLKSFLLLLPLLMVILFCNHGIAQVNKASFDHLEYKGNDPYFDRKINPAKQYFNPILSGFYPDPSICRRGDDYYLINSSFSYYPGLPIFHSKDLVSWKQIGHVLDRPSQLKLDGLNLSAGIFAPTIRYNEANKTFYVICTVVGGAKNFIVKTQDPSKGWSEPILLPQLVGIDPSLFFDEDGRTYITNNGPAPQPKYRAHKVIYLFEYDTKTDKVISDKKIVIDGGVDTSKQPANIEGSHMFKVNGKYYIIAAEGGTGINHSQVAFESDHVQGPYKPCLINPILTQRDLPNDRPDKFTAAGHADLVQTPAGDWYSVFLVTRPYADYSFSTGRETALLLMTWSRNGPMILEKGKAIPLVADKKGLDANTQRPIGNFSWRDDFSAPALKYEWNMLRTPRDSWYTLQNGKLIIDAVNRSIYDKVNPAFLGRRQQHMSFTANTSFSFTPQSSDELAGLVLFQNEKFNLVIGKTILDGKHMLVIVNRKDSLNEVVARKEVPANALSAPVTISIEVEKDRLNVYYSFNQQPSALLSKQIDIKHLTTKAAGGYVGTYDGLYATSTSRIQ